MTKIVNTRYATLTLGIALTLCCRAASAGVYQHGTVVRMRMVDCLPVRHGFMVAMGGAPTQMSSEVCPEYTLISDKVVFVIVGKSSDQLIPLADVVDFRFNKNELSMRIDVARGESIVYVLVMILRMVWDMIQNTIAEQMS